MYLPNSTITNYYTFNCLHIKKCLRLWQVRLDDCEHEVSKQWNKAAAWQRASWLRAKTRLTDLLSRRNPGLLKKWYDRSNTASSKNCGYAAQGMWFLKARKYPKNRSLQRGQTGKEGRDEGNWAGENRTVWTGWLQRDSFRSTALAGAEQTHNNNFCHTRKQLHKTTLNYI